MYTLCLEIFGNCEKSMTLTVNETCFFSSYCRLGRESKSNGFDV